MTCPICGSENAAGAAACASCGVPLAGASPNLLPEGTRLLSGTYLISGLLGQGGFGITYLGKDIHLTRLVAIKEFFPAGCARQSSTVLPTGAWSVPGYAEARRRFLEEGQTLARFSHAGIVRVFAAFEQNNTAYVVMEHLDGESLAAVLRERGGCLGEAEALGYATRVARALAEIHREGLLHRDIKPGNIMVCRDGRVVLVDFGAAREFAAGGTQHQSVMVTPGYAPLEQYAQRAQRGPFTDIYALAATLYHLLTGQVPVAATDRAAGVPLPGVRELNPAVSLQVAEAVMAGLAMEVGRRPQTAGAFLEMLAGAARAPAPTSPAQLKPELRWQQRHSGPAHAVAVSADGHLVASGGADKLARVWDADNGRELLRLYGHNGWVNAVAFSPNGHLLATGSADKTVRIWDLGNGREVRRLRGHWFWGEMKCVAFSPDGILLAAGSGDNVVRLWGVSSGREVRRLEGYENSVSSVAFSPRADLLASGGEGGTIHVWDMVTGRIARRLAGHTDIVLGVAFSPDGALVASASGDTTARLWNAATGQEARCLEGHAGPVFGLAFVGAALLATASGDRTARLWQVNTGWVVAYLDGHMGSVRSVAASPDGRMVATASGEGAVRLWRLA